MRLLDTIRMASSGLALHRSRSLLTILGIVIGIAAIIVVVALGESAKNLIIGKVQNMGPKNVFVVPGRQPSGIGESGSALYTDSIVQKDIDDLGRKANIPNARSVTPIVFGNTNVLYGSQSYTGFVFGSTPGIARIFDLKIAQGELFADEDVAQKQDVAVIGSKVAEQLFGADDPLGKKIRIKDKSLKVVGVLAKKGPTALINFDEAVIAPYPIAQQYIFGIKHFHRVIVEADTEANIPYVKRDIQTLLRNNHNIDDPKKDDFFVMTQDDIAKTVGTITDILTILLSAVAAISLVVAGVGIMNIMFIAVTERTREIGLRKAIGATNRDILLQFLSEAMVLTIAGGAIGIAAGAGIGIGIAELVNRLFEMDFTFTFPVTGAAMGVAVSAAIGFLFGIVPARKASLKSPMEALRYE